MPEPAAIHVTLVPAGDDGDRCSEPCQRALRHFYDQLRAGQMKVMPRIFTTDRAGAAGTLVGEFVIPIAAIVGPVLVAAVTAWFEGRAGRKLRLKVGDIEVEAGSEAELERLLDRAHSLKAGQTPPTAPGPNHA